MSIDLAAVALLDADPKRTKSRPKHLDLNDMVEYRKRGLSLPEIGKLLGCSHQAVQQRLARNHIDIDEYVSFKTQPASHMQLLQHRLLKSITEEDIKEINAYQRVIAVAALDDKIATNHNKRTQVNTNVLAQIAISIERARVEETTNIIEVEGEIVNNSGV